MTRRALPLTTAICLCAVLAAGVGAGPAPLAAAPRRPPPHAQALAGDTGAVLPLHVIAARVAARYRGRIVMAELAAPRPFERALGVRVVHRLRLLTPRNAVLGIRLDAETGRFLEIAGRGQTAARILPRRSL